MSSFQMLSDREHIRKRFSMYGGSQTRQPTQTFRDGEFTSADLCGGLIKTVNEIIDNSVDEMVRHPDNPDRVVSVKVTTDRVLVSDTGLGIPAVMVETPDGPEYQMVSCFTRARAGSNFNDDERVSIGMNGVGSMITYSTALSFDARSGDGQKTVMMKAVGERIKVSSERGQWQGTEVKWKPDLSFFGMTEIDQAHQDAIRGRVEQLALAMPDVTFKFNGKQVRGRYQTFFGKGVEQKVSDKCMFSVHRSGGEFEEFSLVNGLQIKEGSITEYFMVPIVNELRQIIEKRHKIQITPAKLRGHLRFHCVVSGFPELKFDSQTKERVTNSYSHVKNALGTFDPVIIAKKLSKDRDLVEEITAFHALKQKLQQERDLKGLEKKVRIKSDKYFQAVGETKRIFVVEGDSASGGLIKCLGRKGNAFFAMQGLPLNVLEVSHQKFIANKELLELYQIIQKFPEAEICIATDADADGSRIRGLVMLFMHKFFEEHFTKGLVKVFKTPLAVGRKKGKPEQWAYEFDEIKNIDEKLELNYLKGLGSWSQKDLQLIIEKDTFQKMLAEVTVSDATLFTNWFSRQTSQFRKEQIIDSEPFDIMKI